MNVYVKMSKTKRTTFNNDWLADDHFSSWLKPVVQNKYQVFCILCRKTIELSNMGRQAILSHQKSAMHCKSTQGRTVNQTIGDFLGVSNKTVVKSDPQSVSVTVADIVTIAGNQLDASVTANSTQLSSPETSSVGSTQASNDRQEESVKDKRNCRSLSNFVSNDSVIKSEIIWCLKIIMGHLSFRSCLDLGETFRTMFPDSVIAQKFTLSKTKAAY
jgi:hypothetical protein